MFQALREAFHQAVENFREELERDELPEALDRARSALSREFSRAEERLRALADEMEAVQSEAEVEGKEAEVCLRREALARGIGDAETADVARRFAARHLRRREILGEKAGVLAAELADRREELMGMRSRYREILSDPEVPPGVAEFEGQR